MDTNIYVIGAGTMGRGIAQVAAQSGFNVYLSDVSIDVVNKSMDTILKGLDRLVEKGKITQEDAGEIMGRIIPVKGIEDCDKADFIIEAAIEDVKSKQEIFRKIDEIAKPEAILASNTTSCSITEIASATKTPERVSGMHFFNPATIMKLVEIMPGVLTNSETVDKLKELAVRLGKEPVVTKKEGPAGVTSRILSGLLNEAVWVFYEGLAAVDDIDKAVVLGCNHKIGPLALIDLIGVDIHLAKTKMLYDKTGDPRYRPCYLLEQMVNAGLLGKKSGKGFYDYSKENPVPMEFYR